MNGSPGKRLARVASLVLTTFWAGLSDGAPPSSDVPALPVADEPALAPQPTPTVTPLLDARVSFLGHGEDGRLAVLADEDGAVVPYRFEAGRWQRLALPRALPLRTATSALGLYFGRDDRPRLMGYHLTEQGTRLVYLRYRDGAWQHQRREVGALGRNDAALFGELGSDDPEIVCRDGGECLLKSRKGWTVYRTAPPKTAIARAFSGRAYALTAEGLHRGEAQAFVRLGEPAPWRSPATGFWVGPTGEAVVVEPAANALHFLDPKTGTWRTEPSPVAGPRDVVGPADARLVVGDEGLVALSNGSATRIGAPSLRLTRVLSLGVYAITAGPSGVFRIEGYGAPSACLTCRRTSG